MGNWTPDRRATQNRGGRRLVRIFEQLKRDHGLPQVQLTHSKLKRGTKIRLARISGGRSDQPYPIDFDYLITYINWYVRERLGVSARGMIILDKKDQHHDLIEQLMHERRFGGAAAHRVKWVVEFSYSVDSQRNPMVQLSDLVIYCTKRFIEIEKGHRDNWPQNAKNFYARCYSIIRERVARTALVERNGRNMDRLNAFITAIRAEPRVQWRRHYDLAAG